MINQNSGQISFSKSFKVEKGENQIKVNPPSSLPAGFYILRIIQGELKTHFKIKKE
jgi:hypothetical protein